MKIIYQDSQTRSLRKLRKYAYKLREQFMVNASVDVLFSHFEILNEAYEDLRKSLPDDFNPISDLGRHIGWTGRYLSEGKPDNCINDVIQISENDIDAFEDSYFQYQQRKILNKAIPDTIVKLLAEENNDSAVRKAFIILTERIRSKFNRSQDEDGRELINAVFGKNGQTSHLLPPEQREALRDLLSGLYGVFRNRYMHSEQIEWSYEADVIVGIINVLLYKIDTLIPKDSTNEIETTNCK